MTAVFVVPNFASALVLGQAEPDALDWTTVADGVFGRGLISGGVVSPTSPTQTQAVAIVASVGTAGGVRYNVGATASLSVTNNATVGKNRYAIIYARTDGTYAAYVDTTLDASDPSFPTYAAVASQTNFLCIVAAVWCPGGPAFQVQSGHIVPKAMMLYVSSYGPLDPHMFGAKGDDTTLDGTAVQTCEQMCRTLGREFQLSGGRYFMRNPARTGTDGAAVSGSTTDPTTWVWNSASMNASVYDVGKPFSSTTAGVTFVNPATGVAGTPTVVGVNSASQVRLSLQPVLSGATTGLQWKIDFGAALLISDMAFEASDPSVPSAAQFSGDFKVRGAGRGRATLHWKDDPGVDIFGMSRYCWNWLNTLTDLAQDIEGISIIGNAGAGAVYNPNATPVAFSKGRGLKLLNRGFLNKISISNVHTGLAVEGALNVGFYVTLQKTNGVNYVDIDSALSPAPPQTLIGMNASGGGIPSSTTITGVQQIGSVWRVSLSKTLSNAANASTDFLVDNGNAILQNTDHFETYGVTIQNCRDGYLTVTNGGLSGGGTTGTADQRHHELSIGQCQRAAVVVAENANLRDVTFDSIHVANNAIGFLKEGTLGIVPSGQLFLSEIQWLRAKSEGSGTWVFKDLSRRAICNNWWGIFQTERGCAINGTKTHKAVTATQQHCWMPNSATATRVTTGGITAVTVTGTLPTLPPVQVGDHIAVYSATDATFNDCAVIASIGVGSFTAYVGAQTKVLSLLPWAAGDGIATPLKVDTDPTHGSLLNVKNPDTGSTISLSDGTLVGVIDSVNFFTQSITLVAGATVKGDSTSPGWQGPPKSHIDVKLTVSDQATPQSVIWGPIAMMDLGSFLDNTGFSWQVVEDDSTQNIRTGLFWQIWQPERNLIFLDTDDFPSVSVTHASAGTGPFSNILTTEFVRHVNHALLKQMANSVDIAIGDYLEASTNGNVRQRQTASTKTTRSSGIARTPGTFLVPTNNSIPASVSVRTQEPFVVVAREYICCQTRGNNYMAAYVEGGGVKTTAVGGTGMNTWLCLSTTVAGAVDLWNGTDPDKVIVGSGIDTAASGKIDIEMCEPWVT